MRTRQSEKKSQRQQIRERNRPLRTKRLQNSPSEPWYSGRAVPIAQQDKPSEKPSERANGTPPRLTMDIHSSIMSQPLAVFRVYRMTKSDIEAQRCRLYRLNREGKYHFYTRIHTDGDLIVWRMK